MRYLVLALCINTLAIAGAKSQILNDLFYSRPGLQFGMHKGYTDFQDQGVNYYFRLYNQQRYTRGRFGELSISSGMITGLGYRMQLTSLEYRLGYYLSAFGVPGPTFFGSKGSYFSYAGLGLLYNRPLEINAPDDPLTINMDTGLTSSSFWDFNGGIAPFIPVGFGLELPLDAGTNLTIGLGYNQAVRTLKFNDNIVPKGYWTLSIGLNFKNNLKSPAVRVPLPSPAARLMNQPKQIAYTPIQQPAPKANTIENAIPVSLPKRSINFEILSAELDSTESAYLDEVAEVLLQNRGKNIEVFGHADSIGTDPVNMMISESRARAVQLALIEKGVSPERIQMVWHSDRKPVESNSTSEGRFRNRRANISLAGEVKADYQPIRKEEVYIASFLRDFRYGTPLLGPTDIFFSESMLGMDDYKESVMRLIAYLMYQNADMDLLIITKSDAMAGEELRAALEKARFDLLKSQLVKYGIDTERIISLEENNTLKEEYGSFKTGMTQKNILIPIQSNSGTKKGGRR